MTTLDQTPLWTADAIARATHGHVGAPFAATGISIDSRSLQPGDVFFALQDQRDGHDFLADAFARGAAGAVISRPDCVEAGPCVLVGDVLAALAALGEAARRRSSARRIAVTGSVGKTTVTQGLARALGGIGATHAPTKSLNNHIGVPLTLTRLPEQTRFAVFEIGMNHADEIRPLTRLVAPEAAIVTTIGPVHLENFDSVEGIADAKAEIFEGLVPGGPAIINADNPHALRLTKAAAQLGAPVWYFGEGEACAARLRAMETDGRRTRIAIEIEGRLRHVTVEGIGAHWGYAAAAILLGAKALGADVDLCAAALDGFGALDGRGAARELRLPGGGSFMLVDESYNANPMSMAAAIKALAARPTGLGGRRIAVIGDMLELGPDENALHAALAQDVAAARIDLVFCAGARSRHLWEALAPSQRGAFAPSANALAPALIEAIRPGDVVMAKSSNGSRISFVVEELTRLAQSQGGQE